MLPATSTTTHPQPEILRLYGLGMLPAADRDAVERHVAECATCCESLASIPNDTVLDRLRAGVTATFMPGESAPSISVVLPDTGIPQELAEHPRYRIVRQLGAGGMGTVFYAEHRLMERPVALKVISRSLVGNPQAVKRFQLEVKAAAKLSHANIVAAFDAEQAGDLHFLVMEYVEGISLARQVEKRGALPVPYACGFTRQAALGLQHAFEKGMVHRDIKPQNLMVTKAGRVKILDFGLARLAREQEDVALPAHSPLLPSVAAIPAGLTAAGATLGTPDYIAPEQIVDSRSADIRADIYSLGCTLYFLLAGHPPFPNGTAIDKLIAHRRGRARLIREIRPEVPAELASILEKMMSLEPVDRYATPVEVAQALQPFVRSAAAGESRENREQVKQIEVVQDPLQSLAPALDLDDILKIAQDSPAAIPQTTAVPYAVGNRGAWSSMLEFGKSPRGRWIMGGAAAALMCLMLVVGVMFRSGNSSDGPRFATRSSTTNPPSSGTNSPRVPISQGANPQRQTPPSQLSPPPSQVVVRSSPVNGNAKGVAGNLPPPRILIVIPHRNLYYPDLGEVVTALQRLAPTGKITVASSRREPAIPDPQGREQHPQIDVDVDLSAARAADYDAVVFTGANPLPDMEFLAGGSAFESTRRFISAARREGCVVAALCGGIAVLADTGELRGQEAAFNRFVVEAVRPDHGVTRWDAERRVVANQNTVTATDASDAARFVAELLRVASRRYRP